MYTYFQRICIKNDSSNFCPIGLSVIPIYVYNNFNDHCVYVSQYYDL